MRQLLLPIFLILGSTLTAQKVTTYYDYQWKATDISHSRFVSVTEHTDSGWHRLDFYVEGPVLQMEGWYEDSACKIKNGRFIYGYPDKKMESIGHYVHNKPQGLFLSYHANGAISDSTVYEAGQPVGARMGWFNNGYIADSCVNQADGSGVEVNWFANGNPSSAGRWATGHKRQGRWKFFHDNGQLSAIELYDHGQLLQKQYYDENGQAIADTTNRDHKCSFGKDSTAWLKYLDRALVWPFDYKIVNGELAAVVVTFTVDIDGKVKDAYISTPFKTVFNREALRAINNSPVWQPAIEHNRRIPEYMRQPVVFSQPAD
jgi:hypothetical protein